MVLVRLGGLGPFFVLDESNDSERSRDSTSIIALVPLSLL